MNLTEYLAYVVITFFATSVGTQILKKYFRAITIRKFSLKQFTQDGGFPSSHTAFSVSWTVISIFTFVYLNKQEADENLLLIAASIVTITVGNMCIIIRDALGVRRTVQLLCEAVKKGAECNSELFENIKFETSKNEATIRIQSNFDDIAKKMNIKSGHLPHEVIGGIFWGGLVSGLISSCYFQFSILKYVFLFSIILYILSISVFLKYSNSILEFKVVKKILSFLKFSSTF